MEEVFENIYEHTIRYPGQRYVPRNLFIVKQPIRSLIDRKSTRLNSSHMSESRMPSSA